VKIFKEGVNLMRFGRYSSIHYSSPLMGGDPEIFMYKGKRPGKVLPAFNVLPNQEEITTAFSCVYNDGFQAEFYLSPSACLSYYADDVHAGLKETATILTKKIGKDKYTLDPFPVADVEIPEDATIEQIQLGCEPSKSAYGLSDPLQEVHPRHVTMRSTGFHIHMGSQTLVHASNAEITLLIKLIDRMVGVPSVSILRGLEDVRRRSLYGLPGEYRRKTYGVEYRSLSSATMYAPSIMMLLVELTRAAFYIWAEGTYTIRTGEYSKKVRNRVLNSLTDDEVIDIMNNLKIMEAKKHCQNLFGLNNFSIQQWHRYFTEDSKLNQMKHVGACFMSKGARHFVDTSSKGFANNWRINANGNYPAQRWAAHAEGHNASLSKFAVQKPVTKKARKAGV
jgi:hypothetical protein